MTPKSITELGALKKDIDEVRGSGIAFDDGEFNPEVRCVAVPVKDFTGQVIGAIGISGPIWRLSIQALQSRALIVQAAARRLSAEFGCEVFSSEVDTGSREENTSKQASSPVLIPTEPEGAIAVTGLT